MTEAQRWTSLRFDQFGNVLSGSTPSTTNRSYWDGSIVWVTPNDLSKLNTPYLNDSAKRISAQGLKGCSATLLPARSIVISSRAPIGYIAIPTVEFCTNQGCKSIALRSGFNPEFAYYNIVFNVEKIKHLGEGTTFAEISKAALCKVELRFPKNENEQAKIAEVLSTVDRAIAQTQALIAKQQRIKTGLMQDLLTRGIDEQGNLRTEETHKFKDSPLGRIPVEWEASALGDVGIWSSGGTPSKSNPQFWNGNIPWVSPKDMKTFELGDTIDRISAAGARLGSRVMPAETIFIVIRGMILAHTFPVCFSTRKMAFNQDVKAITVRKGISSRFLAYWLTANEQKMLKITTTATHGTKRFDMDDLYAVDIALPKEQEQELVVKALDNVQEQTIIASSQLEKFQALKNALMQDLLTGNKPVTPLLQSAATN